MKKEDIDIHLDYLFQFYRLGYQHAINVLKNATPLNEIKVREMREYFEEEAKKQGLI